MAPPRAWQYGSPVREADAKTEGLGAALRRWRVLRPRLFELLDGAARITQVSAPAGTGKTLLARSWIEERGLAEHAAWVSARTDALDAPTFWPALLDALRGAGAGRVTIRKVTPAPSLDAAMLVDRLLEDLSGLQEPLWLVCDDVHELPDGVLEQFERLLSRAPAALRVVLLTRRDLRFGLHRLRLEGELTELRSEDLRFTVSETQELLAAGGVRVSEDALERLTAVTEGWATGLRLAALSLRGHPDPERLIAGFSGTERAVAEYLLVEVLERQPAAVRRLLLRTSILERVSGPLADRLAGASQSQRALAELEEAGAFVVALDTARTWFRYHRLFADLLLLELRRTAPEEVLGLHRSAAAWLLEHGHPVEATRHAQAGEDWPLAARLLADHALRLELDGRHATLRELVSGFPAGMVRHDAELAVVAAVVERVEGSTDEAERYLAAAARAASAVPRGRQPRFRVAVSLGQLALATARNDLGRVAEAAETLLELAADPEALDLGLGEELQTLALIDIGIAEVWTGQLEAAEAHLEEAIAKARRRSPHLELPALAHWALARLVRFPAMAEERAREGIDLARRHGWEDEPAAAILFLVRSGVLVWQGRLQESEQWLELAEPGLRDAYPPASLLRHVIRALLSFSQGRHNAGAAAQRAADRLAGGLVLPHVLATRARAVELQMRVAAGDTDGVSDVIDGMGQDLTATPELCVVVAALRLARGDPEGAVRGLAPIVAGSLRVEDPRWEIQALIVEAAAREALNDPGEATRALERALDVAEPDGLLLPFMLNPQPELLKRQLRSRTRHASVIHELLRLLSGRSPQAKATDAEPLAEPLTDSELRVLRYLPTNLTGPEIADELFITVNTLRTHLRSVYAKLGVHRRTDAVKRAQGLALLAPASSASGR